MPPKLAQLFQRQRQETPPAAPDSTSNTPKTRKHTRNYHDLHNFGLEGSPRTTNTYSPKRSRLNAPLTAQEEVVVIPDENPPSPTPIARLQSQSQPTNQENIKKGAWWWKYFDSKQLDKKFWKGKKGGKQVEAFDEHYTCNVSTHCKFERYASKLGTSTTALKDHIKGKHQIREETDEALARGQNYTLLEEWIKISEEEDIPASFEDCLLDWITYDCQAFIVADSKWFKRMLRAGGCKDRISGANTIKKRLTGRVEIAEAENTKLFAKSASTVALSLDGWTSQNNYSVLAINISFLGPDFQVYRRCIEFIEIEGSHSGENLAKIVEKALKKHDLL